jgi:hypothetical protein
VVKKKEERKKSKNKFICMFFSEKSKRVPDLFPKMEIATTSPK